MMSEKRFTVFVKSILDNENDKFLMPNEIADMLNGLVDENEQLRQTIEHEIGRQTRLNKELQQKLDWITEQTGYDGAKFRHIEELKEKLREKEEDEQLYAQEIVKLKKELQEKEETLEQSIRFKALGGNY